MEQAQPGDVVLAKFGKHQFWPALVAASTGNPVRLRLVFFGDHRELSVSLQQGDARRRMVRPFSDLDSLTTRERAATDMYEHAICEAQKWKASLDSADGAVLREAVTTGRWRDDPGAPGSSQLTESEWPINGTVVPPSLMKRASALQLPRMGQPADVRDAPKPTFRVLSDTTAAAALQKGRRQTSSAAAASSGSDSEVCSELEQLYEGCNDGGGDDDDDDGEGSDDDDDDSRFARMHAPLEDLEYRGFAAHPNVGIPHVGSTHVPKSQAARPTNGKEADTNELVGRCVRVPAAVFPLTASSLTQRTPYYDGTVVSQRRHKRQESLEVYFASDHTVCLFSRELVRQWLVPIHSETNSSYRHSHDERSASEVGASAEAAERPRKRQKVQPHARKEVLAGALVVRLRLAGVTTCPAAGQEVAAHESSAVGALLDEILDHLPLRPSPSQ